LEIRCIKEINGIQSITELPDTPTYVKGVINLRGQVIPVIDVRLRFGLEEREHDDRTCIVVVNLHEKNVGIIVDSVSEVIDIPQEDVEPSPSVNSGEGSRFISGLGKVGDEVKILVDIQQLLFENELEEILEAEAMEAEVMA